jgi:hypothetical protein
VLALAIACGVVACSTDFTSDSAATHDAGAVATTVDGGKCAVGSSGCACTAGGGCDMGLECSHSVCVSTGGTNPGMDAGTQSGTDGSTMMSTDSSTAGTPFCSNQKNAIFCADFDESTGLGSLGKSTSGNGMVTIVGSFPGGSAPSSLLTSAGANDQANVTTPTLTAKQNSGTGVDISLLVDVTLPSTGTAKIITLAFTNGDKAVLSIDVNGNIKVDVTVSGINATTMLTAIAAGEHPFRAVVNIGSGSTTVQFYIDAKPYSPPTIPIKEPNTFTLTFGASGTSASYTASYDNVVIL